MAEPTAQNIKEQVRQAQQNALAQAASQQQHIQSTKVPPLLPMSPQIPPMGGTKAPEISINMGKLSLLTLSLSLMFLGAFTFLGGFLFGIWMGGPKAVPPLNNFGEAPIVEPLTTSQMPVDQSSATSIQGGVSQKLKQGAKAIGFGHIASGQAGIATQSAVTGVSVPGIPSFLSPLVTATQYAIGQQLGYKAQRQVGQNINQTLSSPNQYVTQPSIPSSPSPETSVKTSRGTLPLSQQGTGEEYSIQLGVFAAIDNAQALVNHLQALNYSSQIVEGKALDGSTLYYVHSGLYSDFNAASNAALQFASQNIPGALVVKLSPKNKGAS